MDLIIFSVYDDDGLYHCFLHIRGL